ncbi:hypothetical protein A3C99_00135 [Candidatus Daviesbacteria bacterium RIFCSPHIGHO2_02_FULL_37_9]|nr:MAG: hypothetical protein A3C99_00135 [Candidatus Daviesbacteria bacterium RIFCSPHIGHO2_02_FULL_37_9]
MNKEIFATSFIDKSKKMVQAGAFAVVAAVATQFVRPVEAQAAPPSQSEITNNDVSEDDFLDLLIFFRKTGGKDMLGQFLTGAYRNKAGGISVMTEKAEIQKNPATGTIHFGDILNDLSRDGKDGEMEKELKIPPKAKSQQPVAEMKPEVQQILGVLKPDAQSITPVASKNYDGVLEVARFPEFTVQVWNNEGVMLANIGKAALKTTEVPKMAILPEPTDFSHVEIPLKKLYGLNSIDDIVKWAAAQMGTTEAYAWKIVGCESLGDPTAQNPSGAKGLWQEMPEHAGKYASRGWNYWTDWSDPIKNSVVAVQIKQEQGFAAWSCA